MARRTKLVHPGLQELVLCEIGLGMKREQEYVIGQIADLTVDVDPELIFRPPFDGFNERKKTSAFASLRTDRYDVVDLIPDERLCHIIEVGQEHFAPRRAVGNRLVVGIDDLEEWRAHR